MDDEQEAELRNPFPSPPSHYTNYTSHNLKLLALLQDRTAGLEDSDINQNVVLSDQTDVPDWSLTQLEKPRVDWILEEGNYNVFGDTWFLKETIPSLAELGGHQLYPADLSVDRRPALLSVLRSALVTYSSLLNALLAPPSVGEAQEWQRLVEWITILAQNIMAAANDLRPVQARANLETMMRRQLELRREETKAIHDKCDSLEAKLAELRNATQASKDLVAGPMEQVEMGVILEPANQLVDISGYDFNSLFDLNHLLTSSEMPCCPFDNTKLSRILERSFPIQEIISFYNFPIPHFFVELFRTLALPVAQVYRFLLSPITLRYFDPPSQMATRRRIGISTATSEAARRQLMQPVPCWAKMWVVPDSAPPGSSLKVFKWVKTEKTQVNKFCPFLDDEGDLDEPLAPLPDEPEGVEVDEEMDQEEPAQSVAPDTASRDVSEPVTISKEESKAPSPKPHPLSISFQPPDLPESTDDVLDDSLKALDGNLDATVDVTNALDPDVMADLDMSQLGPDGTAFEAANDLSQIEATDTLLGGEMMDQSLVSDPFAEPSS
ncbi:hypothetical protein EW146_g2443 [Bondarzewia mesenterica]|uniref:Mediator of RNA polymerase II transcription subunit 7 n=1 Tax=Bondarzewia mesenterica TaxID=1095465 RepID=A0A4S4M246_9AGAM|nr:hypothetical protein EW146_g2443 [Bondarzewia mesenterica]